ncbi:MAG: xylulokinase [Erysipelotrichaceae bacterium]|nr:xylulokinase [Erysipelotrichaceae bacterium]
MYYIGIDLGTSSLKLLLVDDEGKVINEYSKEYPLIFPQNGWSEQDPNEWWNAVLEGVPELIKDIDKSKVAGIGSGGQMHGLVALDNNDAVIRNAILWNDGRTQKEVDYLNNEIGKETLSKYTANIAFAGFTAPKILWMRNNEKDKFDRIAKIMLPKDYINYKLTGVHCCDYSDASGMLLLDVEHKCWSKEMLDICGISEAQMPKLFESYEAVGTLLPEIADKLGLPKDVKVVAGAGDNAAAAVGTGVVGNGGCNISLGTSGTIFISSDKFGVDPSNGLHAFAHADGNYHLMGCMLSAASCNKWFAEDILGNGNFAELQKDITDDKLGNNRVYFLPYLMGERSPINDVDARGAFIGLSLDTTRSDMVQAVLEGVSFAIRDSFEVAKSIGVKIERSMICGGGSKSPLWQKMIANVLGIPLDLPVTEQGPGYGGAMLAMVACGKYPTVIDAAKDLIKVKATVMPDKDITERYEKKYQLFKQIYPTNKAMFKELAK